jgi:adenylate cyclase
MGHMTEQVTYNTTVVFADVSGSSKLYKEVGNEEANRRITDIVNQLMKAVRDNSGVVIKTIGDEVMCHFVNADDACHAAVAFQRIGEKTLPIRVGMAWGAVIEKGADLFGQAVNDAAAVAKIARGQQIITTSEFKDNLSASNAKKLTAFDQIKLKGGEALSTIYRVDWESSTGTLSASKHTVVMAPITAIHTQLVLTYFKPDGSSQSLTLTPNSPPLHIGRDEDSCKLAIPTPQASRDHCHIDYQYGKFVLVDHSTNGTYVKNADGQVVYLRRQETPLLGKGEIALGEKVSEGNAFIIRFAS